MTKYLKGAASLKDYRYVNEALIDDAIDQTGGLPVEFKKKRVAGLAATGPILTRQADEVDASFGPHRKIHT